MAVPNIFGSATSAIPLSQLDTNFATPVTIGNTAVQLGNTVTSFGNVTLTNVTISSGNVTLTGANVSGTANVSTLIVTGNQTSLGNVAITGNISANIATFSAGSNTAPSITTTGDTNTGIFFPAADQVGVTTAGTERIRIESSGRVGIGTTSPVTNLSIGNGGGGNDLGVCLSRGATTNFYQAYDGTKSFIAGVDNDNNFVKIGSLSSHPIGFVTGNSEQVRITTAGAVLVGTTSQINAGLLNLAFDTGTFCGIATRPTNNAGYDAARFFNSSTTKIGSISCTTTNTSYVTSSDYRLKENIAPMTGAIAKVQTLKPCTYKWKVDGSDGQGFIAHELQEVCPDAVIGEKDGEEIQGVDYGKLTPILTAALQEAIAKIETLEARIAVLEAK